MTTPVDSLSREQLGALTYEVTSAANLLRDGLAALRSMRSVNKGVDSVFTQCSIGVEKLMKLTLGLAALDSTGTWLTKRDMKALGHGVINADVKVRAVLRSAVGRATHPTLVAPLLDAVDADEYWPLLLAALDRYGNAGRFHHLDFLAENKAGRWESPTDYWKALERAMTADHPRLASGLTSATGYDAARRELNEHIAGTLNRWSEMVYRFWLQGAIGDRARQFSSAIDPRQPA
jgi:hypothetical protein